MDGYPQRDTIFEFDCFISLVKLMGCFLFGLLSIRVLLASAASWFGCVVVLSFYFSAYLPISSLIVGIFKSFLVSDIPWGVGYCLSTFDCSDSSLFMRLIAATPHSGIPYVQIGFIIVLWIFSLFSMLSLEFRLVSQCI